MVDRRGAGMEGADADIHQRRADAAPKADGQAQRGQKINHEKEGQKVVRAGQNQQVVLVDIGADSAVVRRRFRSGENAFV